MKDGGVRMAGLLKRPEFHALPVAAHLDELTAAVKSRRVVVQAPPGTGKTTVVPPQVADLVPGRVIVTQPRRIAARAAARRLAHLSGTRPGTFAGHTVRGDSTATRHTKVEFVTTGVLLRRLLRDPELSGVDAVILDEVHERHLDADLTLAMVTELALLREDLSVVAMSATLDAQRWASLLGGAEVVEVPSVLHPLEFQWAPFSGPVSDHRGISHAFLDHVAALTRDAIAARPDESALVFVPGVWEVEQVVSRLAGLECDVLPLHGRLTARQQDAALRDDGAARVVVSTAVAESSLTVPGVRIVVDSCLSREPRFDQARGTSGLVTLRSSQASATQRAGRAARLGPGLAIRCLAADDWAGMAPETTPEVVHADLSDALLVLACWGSPRGEDMSLPTPLPPASVQRAETELRFLGLVDEEGRVTDLGRRVAALPVEPRLGAALLTSAPRVGEWKAAEVVALLAADDVGGEDLAAELRRLRSASHPAARRWREEANRLESALPSTAFRQAQGADDSRALSSANRREGQAQDAAGWPLAGVEQPPARDEPAASSKRPAAARAQGAEDSRALSSANRPAADEAAVAWVVAAARPGWISRARSEGVWTSASGTGFRRARGSNLSAEWLAVWASQRGSGAESVVRSAVALDEATALEVGGHLLNEGVETTWDAGKVRARATRRLGAITLTATPVKPSREQAESAIREAVAEGGIEAVFTWSPSAAMLRSRLAVARRNLGDPWPDVSESALLANLDVWLAQEILAVADGRDAGRADLTTALRNLLPWPEARRLDELVPERLTVPTGSAIQLTYPEADSDQPVVLAVKLQECFGWTDTPTVCGGKERVLLHLLSPAQRPLAVTDDLASFWNNAYAHVRAENRGRYPKHPWPEDPLTAVPMRGTKRRGV